MTPHSPTREPDDQVEIDARELSKSSRSRSGCVVRGQASWLLVGRAVLLVGIIWLLALRR